MANTIFGILLFVAPGAMASALHPDETMERVRAWVVKALQTELAGGGDLHKIASLVYPLSDDERLNHSDSSRHALIATAGYIKWLNVDQSSCGALVGDRFISGFLTVNGFDAEKEKHASYLKRALQPDGGTCFVAETDCRSHWHATGLLFAWLLQAQNIPEVAEE